MSSGVGGVGGVSGVGRFRRPRGPRVHSKLYQQPALVLTWAGQASALPLQPTRSLYTIRLPFVRNRATDASGDAGGMRVRVPLGRRNTGGRQ